MENIIKNFLVLHGICHDKETIDVINEYRNDKHPQVYKIIDRFDNKIFKIRITSNRKNAVKVEKKVCEILEKNIHQNFYPKVLADYKGDPLLGNVLIMEYCPGQSLSTIIEELNENEKNKIVSELIEYVKKIHEIKNNKFTTFNGINYDLWKSFFLYQMEAFLRDLQENNIIGEKLAEDICNIVCHCEISCGDSVLVYYDLKPDNIIYDRTNSEVYLVDFEIARFVDPLMEISKGEFLCRLFNNEIYKQCIWIPFVEGITEKRYDLVLNDKKMKLYMLYHNLSYLNHYWKLEKKIEEDSLRMIKEILDKF